MGRTFKDRPSRYDLPRVPQWARPKPTRVHKTSKQRPKNDSIDRDDYLEDLYEHRREDNE